MKKVFCVTLIALSFTLLGARSFVNAALVDRTVAVVNDEAITESELNETLLPVYEQLKIIYKDDELEFYFEKARRDALNQLIEDRLMLQEARKRKIPVSRAEVDKRLSELKSKFPSEKDFEKSIGAGHMTVHKLRGRIKDQIMMLKLFNMEVRSRILVDPNEITEFFNSNKDSFRGKERVKVSNITTKFKSKTEKKEALVVIQKAFSLVKEGQDFKRVAKRLSDSLNAKDGGDLGILEKGQMRPEIERIIFSLKEGEISKVVETESSFNIFLLEKKFEIESKILDEVKDDIKNALFQKKLEEKFNRWISELKEDSYIVVK